MKKLIKFLMIPQAFCIKRLTATQEGLSLLSFLISKSIVSIKINENIEISFTINTDVPYVFVPIGV